MAGTALPGHAQDVEIQDVVVTAPDGSSATTSEKQAKALQSVPSGGTVVTEDQIQAQQITTLNEAKKLIPSLSVKTLNIQNLTYNIRGLGEASGTQTAPVFSGVPIYVDGVYFSRPGTAIVNIPDLAGIQVLKGPQATGGGWDSTGGAVYLTTLLPSFEPEQTLSFSYGTYNHVQWQASATGPFADSDKVAFRLTAFGVDRDGYILGFNNGLRYNDWHNIGTRAQLLLQPDNNLTIRFSFDFTHLNFNCCVALTNGVITHFTNGEPVPDNFFQRSARVGYQPQPFNGLSRFNTDLSSPYPTERTENWGASANVAYNFDGYTFTSVTAFRKYDYHCNWHNNSVIDVDTIRSFCGNADVSSVQQEFTLFTPKDRPIEAKGGVFFYYENYFRPDLFWFGGQFAEWNVAARTPAERRIVDTAFNWAQYNAFESVNTKSVAPYAQAVWHATPELDLTAGARFSVTARSGSLKGSTTGLTGLPPEEQQAAEAIRAANLAPPSVSQSGSTVQGLPSGFVSAAYKLAPEVMSYVTYSHGVRPGGPNIGFLPLPAGAATTIKAEEVDNYEVGLKSSFFDQRLLANVAAYVMNVRNYITNVASTSAGGATSVFLANAPRVISRGVELDVRFQPIEELYLYGALAYTDAFYASFPSAPCPFEQSFKSTCDFTGQPLAITPKWAFTLGGELTQNLGAIIPYLDTPVVGFVGADFAWQSAVFSGTFFDNSNSIYALIPPYGLLNVHIGIKSPDDKWNVTGWIHNALDQHYFTTLSSSLAGVGAGLIAGTVGDPLLAGATLRVKF
jgi:iron complex outermembrane receptor protein